MGKCDRWQFDRSFLGNWSPWWKIKAIDDVDLIKYSLWEGEKKKENEGKMDESWQTSNVFVTADWFLRKRIPYRNEHRFVAKGQKWRIIPFGNETKMGLTKSSCLLSGVYKRRSQNSCDYPNGLLGAGLYRARSLCTSRWSGCCSNGIANSASTGQSRWPLG